MRRLSFIALLLALSLAYGAKEESINELTARFENTRVEDRIDLGIRIAQHQLRNADTFYNNGNNDQARHAVDDIVTYCEKARDAAIQSDKHLKNIEIDVRKIADKLRDIKHTLAFDEQSPVEQAIRRLEDVRTTLLKAMFANDHKKDKR